jgi:ABC-2 type transport system permease protein
VFLFFGISTPFLLKYLPEIIKLAGEQIPIEFPPPTAVQSLAEYASTIGQAGLLIAVLMAMGAISNELKNGTALMIFGKPVDRGAFISAKMIALSLNFLVSLILASVVCFIYTIWLIGPADLAAYTGLNILTGSFLLFCLALTLLCSSFFKSSLAAGGVAIAVLISQAGLSAIPVVGDYMPGKLLGWGINLLSQSGDSYWGALVVTLVATLLCLYLGQRVLRNKDL